jgi:hypothetical protein
VSKPSSTCCETRGRSGTITSRTSRLTSWSGTCRPSRRGPTGKSYIGRLMPTGLWMVEVPCPRGCDGSIAMTFSLLISSRSHQVAAATPPRVALVATESTSDNASASDDRGQGHHTPTSRLPHRTPVLFEGGQVAADNKPDSPRVAHVCLEDGALGDDGADVRCRPG